MKHKRNLIAPLLLVPALLAMETRGEEPRFAPAEGTTLAKTIVNRTESTLDDMTMIMGGQDLSEMLGGMEMDQVTTVNFKFVDTYAAVGDGRPTRLARTYEELSSTSEVSASNPMAPGETNDMEMSGSSELEGETVVFTWSDDDEDYAKAFGEDSDGDEELLDGLTEDVDLRGLLPEGEVEVGDAWSVDTGVFAAILAPGGSVRIEPDGLDEMGMQMGGNTPSNIGEFFEEFDGDITVKLDSVADGTAVMLLTIDVSSTADMTEWMEAMMAEQEMPEGMEMEMDVDAFDMEYTFQGEGELRWNLAGGHFESLRLEGEMDQIVDAAINMSMGGQEQAIEQSMTFSGTQEITFSTGGE